MSTELEALLRESTLACTLPGLWAALFYGDDLSAMPGLVHIVLEGLSQPTRVEDVFGELIIRGELAAAEALLEHRGFRQDVVEEKRRLLRQELTDARLTQVRKIEARCDLLRNRARCAVISADEIEKQLVQARELSAERLRDAESFLVSIEKALRIREAEQKKRLRQELFSRLADFDSSSQAVRDWQSQVMSELDKGDGRVDLCLARWFLGAGPQREAHSLSFSSPRRPEWTYSTFPPSQVCRWFRGENPPLDFDRWRIQNNDGKALELLGSLEALVDDPSRLSPPAVERFVVALEEWLGSPGSREHTIEEEERCFFTNTHAGFDPRISALAEPDGLPLVVATGAPLSALTRLPSKTFLLFELAITVGKPRHCLSFGPQLLFRLLGDSEHRRLNFLRALAPQIPLGSVFADRPPQPCAEIVLGREMEVETLRRNVLSLIVGSRGIGKTSLLRRAARDFEGEGWQTIWLDGSESLAERLREKLGAVHASGQMPGLEQLTPEWLNGLKPNGTFVVIEMEDPAQQAADVPALPQLFRAIAQAGNGRIRCVVSGPPSLTWQGGPFQDVDFERVSLRPLPRSILRALLADLGDLLQLSFDSVEVPERLTFYSGGHPLVFYLLLIEVLQRKAIHHRRSRPVIDLSDLEDAWCGSEFRRRCRVILLGSVNLQRDLFFALDCLIQLSEGDLLFTGVLRSELEEWLRSEGFSTESLDLLIDEGLAISREEKLAPRMMLPPSGLGHLVSELLKQV